MVIPEILKGDVHLPLKEGMMADEAISLCNMFYNTTLDPTDFLDTQVFTSQQGIYCLELTTLESEVVVNFVNKTMAPIVKDPSTPLNPIETAPDGVKWLCGALFVQFPEELTFLDQMGVGGTGSSEESYKLATLLNGYSVIGRWMSGTLGDLCAGNFVMVYKGRESEAPDEFKTGDSPAIFVIKITAGSKQGYLCLKV